MELAGVVERPLVRVEVSIVRISVSTANRSGSAATTDGSERYRRIAAFVESPGGTSTTSTRGAAGRGRSATHLRVDRPTLGARGPGGERHDHAPGLHPDRRALPRELGRWRRDRSRRQCDHGEQRGDGGREARARSWRRRHGGRNGSTSAKQDGTGYDPSTLSVDGRFTRHRRGWRGGPRIVGDDDPRQAAGSSIP